jgi:hypothetical protein
MKGKYFTYRKEIRVSGKETKFSYVIRPSVLTFLCGEFRLENTSDYVPRKSFRSLAELNTQIDSLRSSVSRVEVIDNRLSLFSKRVSHEKYEGQEETIHRLPVRQIEEPEFPTLNARTGGGIVGGVKTYI